MLRILTGIACFSAAVVVFIDSIFRANATGNRVLAAALVIAGVYFSATWARPSRKQRKAMQAAQRAQQPQTSAASYSAQPSTKVLSFKVAGVTYQNDDGTDRQTILRHLYFKDKPYADEDGTVTAEIKETDYKGEPAYAVFMNGYQIGFVPKAKIPDVKEALDHDDVVVNGARVTGGGHTDDGEQINYGCLVSLKYTEQ